jgi:hypothetical protein
MGITKLEAAQQQIGTAIWLYFEDRDPISVHTLAAAAGEIIGHLCRSRGVFSLREIFKQAVKPDYRDEAMRKFAEARNFFKHASWKRPEEELEDFTDDKNLIEIFIAAHGLHSIGADTLETQTFTAFMAIVKPDWFDREPSLEQRRFFSDAPNRPRSEIKYVAYQALHLDRYGELPDL